MKLRQQLGMLCSLVLLVISMTSPQKAKAQGMAGITFQTFYDELAPYGQWMVHPEHGSVWIPDVEADFQPYATNGHWVMTEYGNTWVSDYVWGWAPFHYGRWFYDDYNGWCWIPGHEWGPAWVAWRSGGGYYGWAPLGPGVTINVTVNIPFSHWVFVPQRYIMHTHIYRYCIARPQIVHVYHRSVYIYNTYRHNNREYVCGPHRHEIERVMHRNVPVYRIEHSHQPERAVAHNGAVRMYRPEVSSHSPRTSRSTPIVDRREPVDNRRTEVMPRNSRTEYRPPVNEQADGRQQPRVNRASGSERNSESLNSDYKCTSPPRTSPRVNELPSAPRHPATTQHRQNGEHARAQNQVDRQQRVQREQQSPRRSSGQGNSSREGSSRARRD